MQILALSVLISAITVLNAVIFDPNDFPDLVSGLPNYTSGTPPLSYAGFAPVDSQNNSALFYWYFPARGKYSNDVPTLIWLNGGPGSPSMFGLFVENGPFRFQLNSDGGYSLYSIDQLGKFQSWNAYYNVLFIDQPVGTGYSYTSNNSYVKNEDEVGRDMWAAVQYFTTIHPETLGSKWYFTGESYAGRYIPACAYWMLQYNDQVRAGQLKGSIINLQGILVGDGFVLAVSQRITSIFASQTGNLLTPNEYRQAQTLAAQCQQLSTMGPDYLQQAIEKCSGILDYLDQVSGIDALAINLSGEVTATLGDPMGVYLNSPDVIKALHVDGSKKQGQIFTPSSDAVGQNLQGEQLGNSLFYINNLLTRIHCLFYEGNFDAQDGSYGVTDWFRALDGSYSNILTADRNIWYINKGTAGTYTTYQNLTYIVFDFAGHFVPYFELNATVKMIEIFALRGGNWNYYSGLTPTPISDIMCKYSKNCNGNGACTPHGTCNCKDGFGLADCSAQAVNLNTLTSYTLHSRGYLFFKVNLNGNDKLIQFQNEGGVLGVYYTPFNNGPVADEEEAESSLLPSSDIAPSTRSLYLTSYGKTTGYLTVHNTQWFSNVKFKISISTPSSAQDTLELSLTENQPGQSDVNSGNLSYALYGLSFIMVVGAILLLVRLKQSKRASNMEKGEIAHDLTEAFTS